MLFILHTGGSGLLTYPKNVSIEVRTIAAAEHEADLCHIYTQRISLFMCIFLR